MRGGGVDGTAGQGPRDQRLPPRPEMGGGVRGQGQSNRADMNKRREEVTRRQTRAQSHIKLTREESEGRRQKDKTMVSFLTRHDGVRNVD